MSLHEKGRADLSTPQQAVRSMIEAGAIFSVHQRDDGVGIAFTYRIADAGDLQKCRCILATVKSRPPQFFDAFKVELQRIAGSAADA